MELIIILLLLCYYKYHVIDYVLIILYAKIEGENIIIKNNLIVRSDNNIPESQDTRHSNIS